MEETESIVSVNVEEQVTFKLKLNVSDVMRNDSLIFADGQYQVISDPKKKWYKRILQFICLGFYKAPWEYSVKKVKGGYRQNGE